jgi:hypothetical protein
MLDPYVLWSYNRNGLKQNFSTEDRRQRPREFIDLGKVRFVTLEEGRRPDSYVGEMRSLDRFSTSSDIGHGLVKTELSTQSVEGLS